MKENNITIGFQLANHPNKRGLYPIMIRITQNRVSKRIRSPLEVKKEDWNQSAQQYRRGAQDAKVNNARLEDIRHEYLIKYRELEQQGSVSSEQLVEKKEEKETSFLSFAKKITNDTEAKGCYRDFKKFRGFVRKLEVYLRFKKKSNLLFRELSPSFVMDFDQFLHTIPMENNPARKLSDNTIAEQIKLFKRVVNKAIKHGLMSNDDNPFSKEITLTKETLTFKVGLDATEVELLENIELEEGTLMWHSRNAFLFSMYNRGMRSEDLLQLKWDNITSDRLHYAMGKNDKTITNALVPQAKEILQKYKRGKGNEYVFPFLDNSKVWATYSLAEIKTMSPEMREKMAHHIDSGRSKLNNNLKKIAQKCGITKKLSTHVARHTFTQLALGSGTDTGMMKRLLAHHKLDTTQRYCGNFGSSNVDDELARIFRRKEVSTANDLVEQLKGLPEEELLRILAQLK